jgi:hypothetical protein
MKIRRLIGIFGFVYVGLSIWFMPASQPAVIIEGITALESAKEKTELNEDMQSIERFILTMLLQGKHCVRSNIISLAVIFSMSIFLVRKPRDQNQTA